LDRSKNAYHSALVKIAHKTLNISNYGYIKLNVTADIPEQPKIVRINADTSSSLALCLTIPGSILIKSDSLSKIEKFTFEIATDLNFTSAKTVESTNAQIQFDYTQSNTYFVRVKTSNKNGSSAYSPVKTFSIKSLPTIPTISRDADNNLVSSATSGNVWFKDGVATSEKDQKYKPTSPGNYNVKVTQDGCIASSANYYYLITDIFNISATEYIKLAPNPFVNQVNLDFLLNGYGKLNVEVVSITTGNILVSLKGLTTGTPISLANLSSGVYLVKLSSPDYKFIHQFKMVKM
jgi:hypothetical protein